MTVLRDITFLGNGGPVQVRNAVDSCRQNTRIGTQPPTRGHYEAEDLVSVWIGAFPDEKTFSDYLKEDYSAKDEDDFPKCRFWEDLLADSRWHDHDFQETVFPTRPDAKWESDGRDLLG